jgi:hypothetical protein
MISIYISGNILAKLQVHEKRKNSFFIATFITIKRKKIIVGLESLG